MSTVRRTHPFALATVAAEIAGLLPRTAGEDDGSFDFPSDLDAAIDDYSDVVRSMPQNVVEQFFADPDLKAYHDVKYEQAEGLTHALHDLTEIAKSFKTTFRRRRDGVDQE